MGEIESFFAFLKVHIENGGYNKMRSKYMPTPLEQELYRPDENGLYVRELEFYYKPDLVSTMLEDSGQMITTDEMLCDEVFINPEKLYIITKTYDSASNDLIEEKTAYFYDELIKLYRVEMKKFKNYYGQFLMKVNASINRNQFEEGLLIRLNYYIDLVDKQWYVVYDRNGEVINLIKEYLVKIKQFIGHKENNKEKKSIDTQKHDPTKPKQESTKAKYKEYVEFYNASNPKGINNSEARKLTIQKFRISEKTLNRALKGS